MFRSLVVAGRTLLAGLPASARIERAGPGAFVSLRLPRPLARCTLPLGSVPGLERWSALRRRGEPFWMRPTAGRELERLPGETQALFLRFADGGVGLIVPLVRAPARCCLRGAAAGLEVMVETGDARVTVHEALAVYAATGDDLQELVRAAAEAVAARLPGCALRRDKALPAWVDGFGWCTWDAFYDKVDHAKVQKGLESFRRAGLRPRMMILDAGWQRERTMPAGEQRLCGFDANAKFRGGLKPLVRMAKERYGLDSVLAWHAMQGYWGGVDRRALPRYRVVEQARQLSPYLYQDQPNIDEWWGCLVGLVHPDDIGRFFADYHRRLRAQGIDGVKVDNQAMLEGLGQGLGGRVRLMQAYRRGLEASVAKHFGGSLINCMSCSNDMLYAAERSSLTRTSTDFWPKQPESHGLHLWTNALASLWFGEFIHPDWDMFQSDHAMGAFHAAGRAVSGAPVYVSDHPGRQDARLLRRLVCSDGSVLRCAEPAKPAAACAFHELQTEPVPLILVNRSGALGAGFVGAFNVQYHAQPRQRRRLRARLAAGLVPGLTGRCAVYLQRADRLLRPGAPATVELPEGPQGWELATFVPAVDGFAPIGLADKLNSAGAISACARDGEGRWLIDLRDGGRFLAWSARPPASVRCDGRRLRPRYERGSGRLELRLPEVGPCRLELGFWANGKNGVRVQAGGAAKPLLAVCSQEA